jgi:hypothetical protein
MRRDAGRVATRAGAHPAGHCALAIGIGMPGSAWAGARADHFPAAGIPHRRPRSFWCRSSFLVPDFEGPRHHPRKSSQLHSFRCTQTPLAYVLVQGRSRGSAGAGPGAVGSVGCQLQCTCPHGQAGAAAWPGLPPTPRGQPARACGPRVRGPAPLRWVRPGPEGCYHGPVAVRVQFILSQGAT